MGREGQNPDWADIKGRPSFCYHDIWVQAQGGEKVNVMIVDTFGDGLLGMNPGEFGAPTQFALRASVINCLSSLDLSEYAWKKIFGDNGGDRSPTSIQW